MILPACGIVRRDHLRSRTGESSQREPHGVLRKRLVRVPEENESIDAWLEIVGFEVYENDAVGLPLHAFASPQVAWLFPADVVKLDAIFAGVIEGQLQVVV